MTTFAFVFPGQGSQSVGMLDAWGDHPAVRATLEEASQALGEDLAQLIAQGPKEALALTTNTQPVMLVAGVAAYRAWLAEGGAAPAVVAGHSLGEYSALVASGVLTLAQAAPLVRLRAAAMQEAVPVVEKTYGCGGKGKRGLFGKSSGGYGAMVHALMHPDFWSAAASHSGDMAHELCHLPEFPGVLRARRIRKSWRPSRQAALLLESNIRRLRRRPFCRSQLEPTVARRSSCRQAP